MNQQYQIGDYRETYRTFSLPRPERYNWTYEVFDKWGCRPRQTRHALGQQRTARPAT